MTALGRARVTISIAFGKRSRSSSAPSCLPATENGGQGTPPATRSTPSNSAPSTSWRSRSWTFQRSFSGTPPRSLLARRVAQAHLSFSIAARWENPACSKPRACPPAPAQSSSEVRGEGPSMTFSLGSRGGNRLDFCTTARTVQVRADIHKGHPWSLIKEDRTKRLMPQRRAPAAPRPEGARPPPPRSRGGGPGWQCPR